MSVLRVPFEDAPQPLGMPCWEGMATSDASPRIAWNRSDIDYTDPNLVNRVLYGISEIWTGELRYEDERILLENVELAIDRTAVSPHAVLEAQDFRPGTDELIFTAYAYAGGEVMGVDLATGLITSYSQSPLYEESESVAPNGAWVLVERDLDNAFYPGPLDIWLLPLDGSQAWDRLTHFNRYRGGWYASNPAVNPSGTHFAFQLSIDGDVEGEGRGILLFDIAASGRPTAPPVSGSTSAGGSGCSVSASSSGGAAWLLVAVFPGLLLRVRGRRGSTDQAHPLVATGSNRRAHRASRDGGGSHGSASVGSQAYDGTSPSNSVSRSGRSSSRADHA
jgi:hypothetical protein